jgi:hypothetical protein
MNSYFFWGKSYRGHQSYQPDASRQAFPRKRGLAAVRSPDPADFTLDRFTLDRSTLDRFTKERFT